MFPFGMHGLSFLQMLCLTFLILTPQLPIYQTLSWPFLDTIKSISMSYL